MLSYPYVELYCKKQKKGKMKMKHFKLKIKTKAFFLVLMASLFSTQILSTATATEPDVKIIEKQLEPKQQYISGPCWAFACVAVIEVFLCKKGIYNESLSEKHLLSWANQVSNENGWHIPITHGASSNVSKGYLMSGVGPVLNRNCPYTTTNSNFSSHMANCRPVYWIKGIKNLETDISSIKKAISEYGSACIVYSVSRQFNHAVVAIGWNDNKREWIVKNSASSNNYCRLPFNTKILDGYCITDAERFDSNRKIYQHDEYGVTGGLCCDNRITVANVFDFGGNEILDSVVVNSTSEKARIKLYCTPISSNGAPCDLTWTWLPLYNGVVPYSGYFTLNLQNKLRLPKGRYAIIAQVEKTGASSRPTIGCQKSFENLKLPRSSNRSFIYQGTSFVDVQKHHNSISAFSIKAVTLKN